MSRRRNRSRTIVKAQNPAAAGAVSIPLQAIIAAMTPQVAVNTPIETLPRPAEWAQVPFAPGMPLVPRPINEPNDQGGYAPRRYDFQPSANLPGTELRLVPWKVLRDAADKISLIRKCLEVRKAEVQGLGWDIVISEQAMEEARRKSPDLSDAQITEQLTDDAAGDLDRLRTWWEMPDKTNGFGFDVWLGQAMEELLVLDALAIYPRLTRGGDLFSLEVLDGSTIKPLLDERGNTPMAPYPAYQQVLQGFPRGEFSAETVAPQDGDGGLTTIPNAYGAHELVYARRCVRTWTPYGYSPVEQSLVDADLWLKRQQWMGSEYDDGAVPASWITTDSALQPEQLRGYQNVINEQLSGMTRERHRHHLLPKGFTPLPQRDAAERYRPDYDEFLLKLVCGHFGVLPTRIGITPKNGLGGKGHQDGEENTENRISTRPTTEWLAALLTQISRQYLGMPRSLKFAFLGLDAEDEKQADETDDLRFKSGRTTLNETRDRIGKPRYDFPEADMPMIVTATGVIFLEGEKEVQEDAQLQPFGLGFAGTGIMPAPGAAPAAVGAAQPTAGAIGPGPAGKPAPPKPAPPAATPAATPAAKADELRTLRRWLTRATTRDRLFQCKVLDQADLEKAGLAGMAKGAASPREVAGLVDARPADRPAHSRHPAGFEWPHP